MSSKPTPSVPRRGKRKKKTRQTTHKPKACEDNTPHSDQPVSQSVITTLFKPKKKQRQKGLRKKTKKKNVQDTAALTNLNNAATSTNGSGSAAGLPDLQTHVVSAEVVEEMTSRPLVPKFFTQVFPVSYWKEISPYCSDYMEGAQQLASGFNLKPREKRQHLLKKPISLRPYPDFGPKVRAGCLGTMNALSSSLAYKPPRIEPVNTKAHTYMGRVSDSYFRRVFKFLEKKEPSFGWSPFKYRRNFGFRCNELMDVTVLGSPDGQLRLGNKILPAELKTFHRTKHGKNSVCDIDDVFRYLNQIAGYQISNFGSEGILILIDRRRSFITCLRVNKKNIQRAKADWAEWAEDPDMVSRLFQYHRMIENARMIQRSCRRCLFRRRLSLRIQLRKETMLANGGPAG